MSKSDTKSCKPHWLPLTVDASPSHASLSRENYHYLDGGCGHIRGDNKDEGIGLSGCMTTHQAEFIATACNSYASNQAELKEQADEISTLRRELVMVTWVSEQGERFEDLPPLKRGDAPWLPQPASVTTA